MDHAYLTGNYNVYLVVLSYVIAILASFTALDMTRRVSLSSGWRRKMWLASGAVAMGIGIWAMHFVAMLAFHLDVTVTYNILLVIVSILVPILASLGGLYAASRSTFSLKRIMGAGIIMGMAIGGMHYIGMAAMEGVEIHYKIGLFALSMLVAIGVSVIALMLAFHFWHNRPLFTHLTKVGSGFVMGSAIIGMHFTGMHAAVFTSVPDNTGRILVGMDPSVLAIYVAIGSIFILIIVLVSSYFADRRLAEQVAFNGSILESAIDCILMMDNNGTITEFNRAAGRTFGYNRPDALGEPIDQFVVSPRRTDKQSIRQILMNSAESETENRFETYGVHADGYEFPIEITVTQVKKEGFPQYTVYIRDITERRQVEEALRESEERYRRLVDFSPEAIVVHRHGKIIFVNEATKRLLGIPSMQMIVGHSINEWVEADRTDEVTEWVRAIENSNDDAGPFEIQLRRLDGKKIDIEANSILIQYEGESFIQTIARDITEKKKSEQAVNQMAYYDGLTGLPNRNKFNDLVTSSLEAANTYRLLVAVMFIDLDRFKYINDTLGHPVGDILLKMFSQRLSASVRDSDTISRLGGDEFIVLLPNITHDQAGLIAQRMMTNIAKPFVIEEHTIVVSASIGIALFPDDGDTSEMLIKNADTAMYEAKGQGKNSYRFYNSTMHKSSSRQLQLEQGLRQAIEEKQFIVHYQPKISMETDEIVGAEALLRWQHPELGFISPNEFIPLAEQSGLIVPIGEWTLRTACAQNKAWQDKGYPPMRIAVNLSMLQFRQDDLIGMLLRILQETGMSPQYLELEITESVTMNNQDRVIEKMHSLKKLGIQISIDDFGTGYSSLGYLRKYPFDTIKLDRSFVRDLNEQANEIAAIVQSIIEMAHTLRMNVLAEGVETVEQMKALREHNCDEVQGYLLCKPVPADVLETTMLDEK